MGYLVPYSWSILLDKGLEAFSGILGSDALAAVVQVDENVAVVAHAEFLHVGELAQAVTALDALKHVVMLFGCHGVDDVHAGLVNRKQVGG